MQTTEKKKIGKYDIAGILGRGGMGVVYLGLDPNIGRQVAIKTLGEGFGGQPEMLDRFYSEARTIGALHHPNIVTIYEFGDEGGEPYIVMEYVEGESLYKLLASGKQISMIDRLTIIEEVCSALGYAHQQGVIHRDIKPANVIVQRGQLGAKILDFGIARTERANAKAEVTQVGAVIGTLHYLAPERLRGLPSDGRADIFAVGVMLYLLLAGQLPFAGEEFAVMQKILNEPYPPLRDWVTDYPQALDDILGRALAKEPADRYATAEDFSADLRGVIEELKKEHVADLLISARELARINEFDGARDLLNQILKFDPRHTEGRNLLSAVQLNLRQKRDIEVRDKVTRVGPLSAEDALERVSEAGAPEPGSEKLESLGAKLQSIEGTGSAAAPFGHPAVGGLTDLLKSLTASSEHAENTSGQSLPAERRGTRLPEDPSASSADPTVILPRLETRLLRSDVPNPNRLPAAVESIPQQPKPVGDVGSFTAIFQTLGGKPEEAKAEGPGSAPEADPFSTGQERPSVVLTISESADSFLRGQQMEVSTVPFVVGRSAEANLAVESDVLVSRMHCEINWQGGNYVIRDCGSVNGTWLNGQRLAEDATPIDIGGRIRLSSSTVLTFGLKQVYRFPDLIGSLVNDRYRLEQLVRGTPKSALYRAADQRMSQSVAIKILSPELVKYPGYVQAFTREAEVAVAMRHPHIVRALDYGPVCFAMKDGGLFASQYICTEFLNGGSLETRIGEGRVANPAEVAQWLNSLSEALNYAHSRGIVHGGLKSNSVVFDEESRAFLMDFANVAHSLESSSKVSIGGAPDFMAPEQWEGEKPTALTDQYALGVLVYYALTGSRPFVGQIDPTTRRRNFENGPPCLHEEAARQKNFDVGPNLTAVVERALSPSPASRFPDVRTFYNEFAANLKPREPSLRQIRVFLSYRRELSSGWAQLFSRVLSARGISFFIDTSMRDRVVRFPKFLEERIKECDVFVCLLADHTLESDWVLREVRLAAKYKRPMVPVYQEGFSHVDAQKSRVSGVRRLLNFDGLKLSDRENEYIDAVMNLLEKKIKDAR